MLTVAESFDRVINWPLLTDLINPDCECNAICKSMAKKGKWDSDDVPKKVAQLRKWLETPTTPPTVIYVHCEAGVDRTGEMAGSYLMQHKNETYQQCWNFNNHIENRQMSKQSRNGLRWYAYYACQDSAEDFS